MPAQLTWSMPISLDVSSGSLSRFLLSMPLLPRLNLLAMLLAIDEYGLSSDTLALRLLASARLGALGDSLTDMDICRRVELSETVGGRLDGLEDEMLGLVGLMLIRITSRPSLFRDRCTSMSSDIDDSGDL